MSLLPSRSGMARLFGLMFGGRRSIIEALGYESEVTYQHCLEKYKRQGVFSRIVNAYPDALWSRPPLIIGNENLDIAVNGKVDEEGNTVTDGFAQTVSLYHYLNRADRLAGLGKYSVLLLGFDDVTRSDDLRFPVAVSGTRKLNFVQAYGYGDLSVSTYTTDPSSDNFGLPELYSVKVRMTDTRLETMDVHHSRIVHIADTLADNEIMGYPIGERVYNECDDLLKVSGGGAESVWLGSYKGLQFDVDKEMHFTQDQAKELRAEIEEYVNGLRRAIRTRGVNIKDIGSDNINVSPMFNVIVSLISTATGMPQRIFIGSEQGKLASEQDRQNWACRVDERRELHAEPRILRPLIKKCQSAGALPDGRYELEWPDAYIQSPLERGQTSAQVARSAINIARTMEVARGLIDANEGRTILFASRSFGQHFGSARWPYGNNNPTVVFPSDQRYEQQDDEPGDGKDPDDEDDKDPKEEE